MWVYGWKMSSLTLSKHKNVAHVQCTICVLDFCGYFETNVFHVKNFTYMFFDFFSPNRKNNRNKYEKSYRYRQCSLKIYAHFDERVLYRMRCLACSNNHVVRVVACMHLCKL